MLSRAPQGKAATDMHRLSKKPANFVESSPYIMTIWFTTVDDPLNITAGPFNELKTDPLNQELAVKAYNFWPLGSFLQIW